MPNNYEKFMISQVAVWIKDGKVLVLESGKRDGRWEIAGGRIDEQEDSKVAFARELKEEIGTNKAEIIAESEDWIPYDLPGHLADRVWHGKFRGQTQKWFAMRFLGRNEDINLATAEPEFDAWKWTPMASLADVVVDFKRENYRQVVAAFSHLA